jgi:hypothetical protein
VRVNENKDISEVTGMNGDWEMTVRDSSGMSHIFRFCGE